MTIKKKFNIIKVQIRNIKFRSVKSMENNILMQLKNNEISKKEAYKQLYPLTSKPRHRRAHFVKLRISIPDSKGVSRFLAVLFLLPCPIFLVRFALRFAKLEDNESIPFTKGEIMKLISSKGIKIDVRTHSGEIIHIRTI